MTDDQLEARLANWYADSESVQAPVALREAVLAISDASVARTDRRIRTQGWRPSAVKMSGRLAIMSAGAVVVVIIAAINLLPTLGQFGGPGASPSAPPGAATPQASPSTTPGPTPPATQTPTAAPGIHEPDVEVAPGRYAITAPQARVHLTLPSGWSVHETGVSNRAHPTYGELSTVPYPIAYLVATTCVDEADVVLEPVGSSFDDLTAALARKIGTDRSGASVVTVGGYTAKRFELHLPPQCDRKQGGGIWADPSRAYGLWIPPGWTTIVYIVDRDGIPLVLVGGYARGTSAEEIAQLEAIVGSIDIEWLPSPARIAEIGPTGGLLVGRHSLTVDGIRFSFETPAHLPDGWARFGDVYIAKSIRGPQDAEAVIYWTRVRDSSLTEPCDDLRALPIDASAATVTAYIATAPGSRLVTGPEGPETVSLGGRVAQHLRLVVEEDVGCGPGFLYTWGPVGGGPFWNGARVGDTLDAYVADVDGRAFVIVSIVHPQVGQRFVQEVDHIIRSIEFE